MKYKRLTYLLPKSYKERIKKEALYAGFEEKNIDRFINFVFIFPILIAVASSFVFWLFFSNIGIAFGAGIGILLFIFLNVSVSLIADSRTKHIELILPDALQLMAA